MNNKKILIVGAGYSGAVLARELAESLNCTIHVLDERTHIGGNCHTEKDKKTGVLEHVYGPHIFNTNREDVWKYVNKFSEMKPYINRVKSVTGGKVFSMPINLHTINQFFNKSLSPKEAIEFIKSKGDKSIKDPKNFEEQAIKMIGKELYEAFFYGYTKKQWGCEPKELAASILKRLPVRFNYDDNYYNSVYQGIPKEGYTEMIRNILDNSSIKTTLNKSFEINMLKEYDYIFYTGPLDRYFNYKLGRLSYRTVTFEKFYGEGDFQGNAVINYPEPHIEYTRIHEHKHFSPWESHEKTIYFKEYSKETTEEDIPYYPKRLEEDLKLLEQYKDLAEKEEKVFFLGRLATYRYLNMDQCIAEALDYSKHIISRISQNKKLSKFSVK